MAHQLFVALLVQLGLDADGAEVLPTTSHSRPGPRCRDTGLLLFLASRALLIHPTSLQGSDKAVEVACTAARAQSVCMVNININSHLPPSTTRIVSKSAVVKLGGQLC